MKTLLILLLTITAQAQGTLWIELIPNTKQPAESKCQETWSHYCRFPYEHLWDKTAKIPTSIYSFVNRYVRDGEIIKSDVSDTIPTKVIVGGNSFEDLVNAIVDARIAKFREDSLTFYRDTTSWIGKGTKDDPARINPRYINSYMAKVSMTSTARNALKPYEGQVIFNTSTKLWQIFTGGVWK